MQCTTLAALTARGGTPSSTWRGIPDGAGTTICIPALDASADGTVAPTARVNQRDVLSWRRRNYETPGEDPYLSGEYAAAFVQGFQESPVDPRYLQASACCKHYDANSMESSTEAGVTFTRHNFDANVTMQVDCVRWYSSLRVAV